MASLQVIYKPRWGRLCEGALALTAFAGGLWAQVNCRTVLIAGYYSDCCRGLLQSFIAGVHEKGP